MDILDIFEILLLLLPFAVFAAWQVRRHLEIKRFLHRCRLGSAVEGAGCRLLGTR